MSGYESRAKHRWKAVIAAPDGETREVEIANFWCPEKGEEDGRNPAQEIASVAAIEVNYRERRDGTERLPYIGVSATLIASA